MSDASISAQRGTSIEWLLPATLNGAAFDLTPSGTIVVLTVKRRRSDLVPLIEKTYTAGQASTLDLLAASTDTLKVVLDPVDTEDFTKTEFLVWDALLTEPDGDVTPMAKGSLTVREGVGS